MNLFCRLPLCNQVALLKRLMGGHLTAALLAASNKIANGSTKRRPRCLSADGSC
jgi:hypothetical protein